MGRNEYFTAAALKSATPYKQKYSLSSDNAKTRVDTAVVLSARYQDLKFRVLDLVYDQIDARGETTDTVQRDTIRQDIFKAMSIAVAGADIALNNGERENLLEDCLHEITGYGPLQPLLLDDTIDDIIVNRHDCIYVERHGNLEQINARFRDQQHLLNIIQRIVSPLGRRVDESSPFVDARLPDGSRVNIAVPPVTIDGPAISIRKFKRTPLALQDLIDNHALSSEMGRYLADAVKSRRNILICGGTGSGKTTLLNVLSSFIEHRERVVTIEDAAELQLLSPHVLRMETREGVADGVRRITAHDILRNALRMRPDRIILGEVRGSECVDMLQAMTTGHDGSMSTLHANSPKDAIQRLELLLNFAGVNANIKALRRQIASALHIIVHVQRFADGVRRVTKIAEITGLEGETVLFKDIFQFESDPHSSLRGGQFTPCNAPRTIRQTP